MSFIKFTVNLEANLAEEFAEILLAADALSVSFEDAAADEILFQLQPQQTPLWKNIKLFALFANDIPTTKIIDLLKTLPSPETLTYQIEILQDQDWVKLTQQNFSAQCFGKDLWICPSWQQTPSTGKVVILDPGLAFGTGTHPTTALCLEWLSAHPPIQQNVIDYGCGSGVLALAALALGANKVWAVDHDPQALIATANNATKNSFVNPDNLFIITPEHLSEIKVDMILANILANPLISLAPKLSALLTFQGFLVLSGLLENEIDRIAMAYQTNFYVLETTIQEGWARIILQKKI